MTIKERLTKTEAELNHLIQQRDQTVQLLNSLETKIVEKQGARFVLIDILKEEENGNNTDTKKSTSD